MSYNELAYLHLGTIAPAFIIGTYMIFATKGTAIHKRLGKIYMLLMLFTGVVTLFMPAFVGTRLFNHFGFIHLFSFLTLYSVPQAYFAIKRNDVKTHKKAMLGLYIGGLLIAGSFALMPGRMAYNILFE